MSTPVSSKNSHKTNNNFTIKSLDRVHANSFAAWYKRMIDEDRKNLGLYISEDAKLEWFGRTIRTHKKILGFLKYDMHCSRHDFTTVESTDKILSRWEISQRTSSINSDSTLATPLGSIALETLRSPIQTRSSSRKKRADATSCDNSPEWDPNSSYERADFNKNERKKMKTRHIESMEIDEKNHDNKLEINNKGDGTNKLIKRRSLPVTPTNKEFGQGDCFPSTSGMEPVTVMLHNIHSLLPRRHVECNGYIEFTRRKNSKSTDIMKWNRKCKIQICYSLDPINCGEYIIWSIHYSDESKCRRNLLSAFEEVAKEDRKAT